MKLLANGVEVPIVKVRFPAGESLIRIDAPESWEHVTSEIIFEFKENGDLIDLLMLTDAIKRLWRNTSNKICLIVNYLPYARQDRVCNPGEALSVKVIAALINEQGYETVHCLDLHSEVSGALINNLRHTTLNKAAARLAGLHPNAILVSPDAGANKKVLDFAKTYRFKEVVRADKTRDVLTGKITGTVVFSEHVGNADFLILDDICDGGRTFIELAKELRKLTTGKIYLYVSHGIFSNGSATVADHFDMIYVANLMGNTHPLIQEI